MATKKPKGPAAPEARSVASEMASLLPLMGEISKQQAESAISTNQQFIDQALVATNKIAKKLDNGYTKDARGSINSGLVDADRMRELGLEVDTGETEIERLLRESATADLQLGGALTPEEIRQSEQGTRSAWSARGMALSNPAAIEEVLNRTSLSTARKNERQVFAGTVNDSIERNHLARLGTAGNLAGSSGGMRLNAAGQLVAIDPYGRALQSNIPIASQSTAASLAGNSMGSVMNYGADVFNTNLNMEESRYNSYQNNKAALQGADLQNSATGAASKSAQKGQMMMAGGALIGTLAATGIAI